MTFLRHRKGGAERTSSTKPLASAINITWAFGENASGAITIGKIYIIFKQNVWSWLLVQATLRITFILADEIASRPADFGS